MRYQQNLSGRKISVIVLSQAQWPVLKLYTDRVLAAIEAAALGTFTVVEIPFL